MVGFAALERRDLGGHKIRGIKNVPEVELEKLLVYF